MKIDKDWKKNIELLGKDGFEKSEMIRLGFWKPDAKNFSLDEEEKKLFKLYELQAQKNEHLNELNKRLKDAEDLEKQIEKIREIRIKRSRASRAIRLEAKNREKKSRAAELEIIKNSKPPYLGKGVSQGLNFENHNISKLKKRKLPVFLDIKDISKAYNVSTKFLNWLCFHKDVSETDHYHRFKVPKRNGTFRDISSPKDYLRWMQCRLKKDIFEKLPLTKSATAYKKGGSVINNASPHLNKKVVVKMDLKDFFFSISFARVRGYMHSLGYSSGIATVLALICCDCQREIIDYKGKKYFVAKSRRRLQQGAITSPILSNLIATHMDKRISALIKSCDQDASYTRYADDITFSTNAENPPIRALLAAVNQIVTEEGFEVHPQKTKVMRKGSCKEVTGIVVNEYSNVSRRRVRSFRAYLHHVSKHGIETAVWEGATGKNSIQKAIGFASFVHQVRGDKGENILQKCLDTLQEYRSS